MTTRMRWLGLAAVVVGLGATHYWCFRQGRADQARQLAPAVERVKSGDEYVHLTYAVKALRPVAQHPDAIPAADAAELCRQADGYALAIERERLPELRESGDAAEVRRHETLVREARVLIGRIRR